MKPLYHEICGVTVQFVFQDFVLRVLLTYKINVKGHQTTCYQGLWFFFFFFSVYLAQVCVNKVPLYMDLAILGISKLLLVYW